MQSGNENDPLVTRKEAQSMFGGVSRRTIWDWEKKGKLPPPIRLSTRVIGWRRSTIEALLQKASV